VIAIVVGVFLVSAGVMSDRHRWLWPTLFVWSLAIAAIAWLRSPDAGSAGAIYRSAVVVALVMGPMLLGWGAVRLTRRAREGGSEWNDVPR